MAEPSLRVAVVGGSLGGLATAVALGVEAGAEVEVFERSETMQLTEGAGLWVQAEVSSADPSRAAAPC